MTELEIFAKTVFGEARGEKLSGMEAVANVILNRVKHAQRIGSYWWGKTIEEVCLKPFQFSCWNKNDANFALLQQDLKDNKVYKICERIAKRALAGFLPDNTKGATHYHADSINPSWARCAVPCAQIGRHVFYALY